MSKNLGRHNRHLQIPSRISESLLKCNPVEVEDTPRKPLQYTGSSTGDKRGKVTQKHLHKKTGELNVNLVRWVEYYRSKSVEGKGLARVLKRLGTFLD